MHIYVNTHTHTPVVFSFNKFLLAHTELLRRLSSKEFSTLKPILTPYILIKFLRKQLSLNLAYYTTSVKHQLKQKVKILKS